MGFWSKLFYKNKDEDRNEIKETDQKEIDREKEDRLQEYKEEVNKKEEFPLRQTLFIPNNIRPMLTEEQISQMKKIVASLPPLEEGAVNFKDWHIQKKPQGWMVQILFRNGQLEEPLFFEELSITIKDAQGEIIAKDTYDFSDQEPIPPRSVCFIPFIFEGDSVKKEAADVSKWSSQLE